MRRHAALITLPLFLLPGAGARAQTSASVSLLSEYDLRGLSLSNGHPVAQIRVEHEAAQGWYLGGFGSPVDLDASRATGLLIAYGGYAQQLASGLSWDAGISDYVFLRDARYNYREAWVGLALARASMRLSVSPAWYGGPSTAYLELNGAQPLDDRLRLVVHAGLLHTFGSYEVEARNRIDLRVALAADVGDFTLQLGLQARQRDPFGLRRSRALSASASYRF